MEPVLRPGPNDNTETTVDFPSRELHDSFFALLGECCQNERKLSMARKKYLSRFKFDKNARGWTWVTYNVRRLTRVTDNARRLARVTDNVRTLTIAESVRVTEAPSTRSYILRLDLPSTLIRHENGAFRKRLSHDNHVIFVKKKLEFDRWLLRFQINPACFGGKLSMRVFSACNLRFLNFYSILYWTRHQECKTFNSTQCLSFGLGLTTPAGYPEDRIAWCRRKCLDNGRPLNKIRCGYLKCCKLCKVAVKHLSK